MLFALLPALHHRLAHTINNVASASRVPLHNDGQRGPGPRPKRRQPAFYSCVAGFKKSRFQDSTEEVLQPEVLPCAFFAAIAAGRGRSRNGCMHVLVMTQLGMGTCRPGVP